jgi:hypothetical protein
MEKPLKFAAWSGIILIVWSILNLVISAGLSFQPSGILSIVGAVINGVFGSFFLYGFVILGRKFDGNLLQVMAWIGVVLAILGGVLGLLGGALTAVTNVSAQGLDDQALSGYGPELDDFDDFSDAELLTGLGILAGIFLIFWIGFTVILGAFSVLFGVGLLKISKKVKYAKVTGILSIIAGATYIIAIGFIVGIAVGIMNIILLFKASADFEK